MPALSADHLSRSYGSDLVLRDISLTIELGEKVALLGLNGAGKSTLGRILAGWEEPDTGVLARRRELALAFLPQEPVLDPELTVYATVEASLSRWKSAMAAYEEVSEALARGLDDPTPAVARQTALAAELEALGGWQVRHRVERVLASLQLRRLEQRVGELSGGERRRVALAQVLLAAPEFAVLDEPTNHLDADTCAWLETWLREEFPGALLLITHDRYLLDRVVTRVLELDRGVVHSHEGAYGAYLHARATRLALEARAHTRQLNLLRREEDWLSRGPPARTRKSKARIDSARALAQEVQGHPRREERPAFTVAHARGTKRLLSCEGLTKGIPGRVLFQGLEFHLGPGERVGVVGPNGAGKTTLLRVLLGEESPDAGTVARAPTLKVAYFDQARAGLDDALSVYDTLAEGSDRVTVGDRQLTVYAYLELFLFDSHRARQRVGSLSGGERARVALARMLRGEANLLVLDEPTNDLDLFALTALEELLSSFPGAALVVTHDRWFLDRVATSLLCFEPEGRVVQYAGGWDDCLQQRAAAERERAPTIAPSRPPPTREPRGGVVVKPLSPPELRELEALPELVDAAEAELARLEGCLNDPGLYARGPSEVTRSMTEADAQRARVQALTARWEALEARRGA